MWLFLLYSVEKVAGKILSEMTYVALSLTKRHKTSTQYLFFISALWNSWMGVYSLKSCTTHTHTCLTALTRVKQCQKGKTNLDFTEAKDSVKLCGICCAICKSAPRSSQITMPVPHHSIFYRPDALPAAQPTASKHWRQKAAPIICSWKAWWKKRKGSAS